MNIAQATISGTMKVPIARGMVLVWFLSATLLRFAWVFVLRGLGWFAWVCAGIRDYVSWLQASPLCGAAPTFLCRRKEK
ncbi:hypothetical protein [Paraburkholderia terrae]|uniref:hypothetical protein n=1 Tax=Paraburkholderia terrae TaxID=311230 RepID=UPI00142DA4A2|nr:hypothetical protein [Paraburkholderia terrae]